MVSSLLFGDFVQLFVDLSELSKVEEVEEEYMLHEESSIHVRPGYYSPKQVSYLPSQAGYLP